MKSKKTLIIIFLVVIGIFVGGFTYSKIKNNTVTVDTESPQQNIFTSVKDAMSKNINLTCEFKDDAGAITKSYIKNGALRVSSTGEIIMKNKKMYMWDVKTKKGLVYDIPESDDDLVSTTETSTNVNQGESYIKMIEKYKDSCKISTVEDSYFDVPTDIVFEDMSKLLEDLKRQMPQYDLPTQ